MIAAAVDAMSHLHLLRPGWMWALLAIPLLAFEWRRRRRRAQVWREAVDPHLLAHLLEPDAGRRGRGALWLGLLGYTLAILALAGPSWRQIEQPLWQTRAPLVVALDLSSAMATPDIPPSRLLQARAKLDALLRERDAGQVGLVAYAGAPFTVAPLTDDAANLALFLDALEPSIMPVDGQRADRAIEWSTNLLRQAGFDRGDILLLTDHADAAAQGAAAQAAQAGYRVSALGLGTAAGAAYRDGTGAISRARLDEDSLRALAQAGQGRYARLTAGMDDLSSLSVLDAPLSAGNLSGGGQGRQWEDQGYWLLPPLLLLGLLAFRRGGAVAALLLCLWLPGRPALAAEGANWWRRPDQQAHATLRAGAQAYRAGEFEQAARAWAALDTADAHYNRGNALARAGRYEEAIAAYDDALARQPGMPDALANKQAVQARLKDPPPSGGKQDSRDPGGGEDGQSRGSGQGSQAGSGRQRQDPPSAPQPPAATPPPPPSAGSGEAAAPERADPETQREADAAQRERMQRALQRARQAGDKTDGAADATAQVEETAQERERRLANQAWLQRVPDDPGGLLRRKFALEYERRQRQGED